MRLIDADALHSEISKWPESVMYKDWVQSAIATAPTVATYGQWVSVEDKWPQNGEWILAYLSDRNMISGSYYDAMGFALDYYYEGQGEITHWMPLLCPPKEDVQ